jgi:hypothetical protein
MIKGVHTMFYSSEAKELRAIIRDKLQFPSTDTGDGWLIFDLPEADMGCHPVEGEDAKHSGRHDISFYCDDINITVEELKSLGVAFTDEITNQSYGHVTHFIMPGNVKVQLYEPLYNKSSSKV